MRYFVLSIIFLLSACGFEPLYGTQKDGDAGILYQVDVDPVIVNNAGGRAGQVLHSALEDRFSPAGPRPDAPYGLQVSIGKSLVPVVIEPDGNVLRYNVLLNAHFRLYVKSVGKEVFAGSTSRISSYNVSDSDFSSFIAERDATERGLRELAEELRLRISAWYETYHQAGL